MTHTGLRRGRAKRYLIAQFMRRKPEPLREQRTDGEHALGILWRGPLWWTVGDYARLAKCC